MLQSIRKLLLMLIAALPLLAVADDYELPDLGGAGLASLSSTREAAIGRQIIMQLRDAGMIEDDPELQQYINDIGSRLTASTNTRGQEFNFYVIRDDAVNAFALPGGHIGVHTGLIRRTRNESELASVMAHEIAHVTQRHIARRLEENQNAGLTTLATLLGAIAIAAAGGPPDAVGGTLMLGQGLAIQEQINFTRAQEYEADRLGLDILASADYDPAGMISFFETMQRRQRLQGFNLPEYFSTHPLGTSRVVEATQRARDIKVSDPWETRLYPLVKARLEVMARDIAVEPEPTQADAPAHERYKTALEWLAFGKPERAIALFRQLVESDDSIVAYHLGLARAQAAANEPQETLDVIDRAMRLFPESIPVGLVYARLQRDFGQPRQGLRHLRRLFDYRAPDPDTLRLMAQLATDAGQQAESHFYMSEYYLAGGDLASARVQLQLALDNAELGSSAREQYAARLAEVAEALAQRRQAGVRDRQRENRRQRLDSVSPAATSVY